MIQKSVVPALLITACAVAISSIPFPAQGADVSNVAKREIARRQNNIIEADAAIQAGDEKMANDEYDAAVVQYKIAVDNLPDALATGSARKRAVKKYSDASIKLAEQRINEGRFPEAQLVIGELVIEDPENREAQKMLQHLSEPDYYNKTVGPKFSSTVEEVKKKLSEAEGFYDSGRFDLATKRCEQVLGLDPYNIAARRMEEKINKARVRYSDAAYNQTRSQAVWEVAKAWERPVVRYGLGNTSIIVQPSDNITGTAYITAKLNTIIIPRIEFKDATIREAIDYLKAKSRDLDPEPDPAKKGVNIVLKLDNSSYRSTTTTTTVAPASPVIPGLEVPVTTSTDTTTSQPTSEPGSTPITLSLSNVPMIEALKYITTLANLKFKIEPFAVSIVPLSTPTEDLITKQYQVSPGFIQGTVATGDASASPGGDAAGAGAKISARISAKDFLITNGVEFPPGASAIYQTNGSRLIVTNTQSALDLVDTLVQIDGQSAPKQVEIESKFVEITQNNNKELGFDWLLGQFGVNQSDRVFAGGGTTGNNPQLNNNDFPFVDPNNGPVGNNPITGGNRSGSTAISANAIDALLFGLTGNSLRAPGIFGLAGVFTDPQFQLVIRALDQKKGVDLLSSPRVTTKSGLRAVIEIIREFRYPTEFDPPQIPQEVSTTGGGSFPVTPTTPTTFETRNTGVTLEVEPQVGPDGQTIDLTLAPSVTEFEGFINYGSPIISPASRTPITSLVNGVLVIAGFIDTPESVLTANVINQPIFSTRKVQTQVSIWDGQTVVIGGLMREDIQKVEDKTPFLGDLPLVGRLFRSNVDQHLKRNLVIFVTARLMNPAGQPILNSELEEEVIETLPVITEVTTQTLPNFAK